MTTDNNPISGSENEGVSCSECGNTVDKDDRFCPHCGERFEDEETPCEGTHIEPPTKISFSANKPLEGIICKICNDKIHFGDEIAKCDRCSSIYHDNCWEEKEGCNTKSCISGRVACKFCGTLIKSDAVICKNCGRDQVSGSAANNSIPNYSFLFTKEYEIEEKIGLWTAAYFIILIVVSIISALLLTNYNGLGFFGNFLAGMFWYGIIPAISAIVRKMLGKDEKIAVYRRYIYITIGFFALFLSGYI